MELPPLASSLVAVLATAIFLLASMLRRHRSDKYKLPPGPRPWPVIGNLNVLGELPHRSLHELSRRYGPFMFLRLGSFPVAVGSSVDAARFFLKTQDLAFIDRPRMAPGKHIFYNYSGLLTAPYGAYWRQGRKFWHTTLLNARQLALLEHVRVEEVRAMLSDLHAAAVAGGACGGRPATVVLKDHLYMLSLNLISRMVLGKRYVDVDGAGSATSPEQFRSMIEEHFFLNGVLSMEDLIPWLGSWLDLQGYIRRMKELHRMLDRFLEHALDEHVERRRQEGDAFVAADMMDMMLKHAEDPTLVIPIERNDIKAYALDLFAGGTDTSPMVVEWAMSELLRRPDALAKAVEELDRVVGPDRLVAEGDIPDLPYMESIVKETMRLHPVAPLLSPRLCREQVSTGAYDIPAGTRVLVNVWAIGRDPAVWDSPDEFRPERFLGSGIDVKGQDMELLPFGSGRRMCPGVGLGLKMVQVTLANLLHAFAWRLPDGVAAEELSMDGEYRLTVPRKFPLEAVAEPKLPAHLYLQQAAGP